MSDARGDKLRDVGCTCPRKNLDGPPQGVTRSIRLIEADVQNQSKSTTTSTDTPHCRTQCHLASCCKYLWANAIAMLPSPTAEATRLTGLNLTSPQANTPGTLDSRR